MGLQWKMALGFKPRHGSHLASLFGTMRLSGDHVAWASCWDHVALDMLPFAMWMVPGA